MENIEYEKLVAFAKKIDPINYLDIAHDYILDGGTLKGLKFKYNSVNTNDFLLRNAGTCNTCTKCNQIKPVAYFRIFDQKYLGNTCKDCLCKYAIELRRKKCATDPEYKERFLINQRYYAKVYKNTEHGKLARREEAKRYRQNNKEKVRDYQRAYREKNREKVRAQSKKKYERQYDKLKQDPEKYEIYLEQKREYSRNYYAKKKLEMQID